MIDASLLDAVGSTPLVSFRRLCEARGVEGELLVKCEHLNVTGSHKIRAARAMFDAAERRGELRVGSGQTALLATGGNLGKGAALLAAVRGYRLVLVIPDDYSPSKIEFLQACGARVVLADHTTGGNAHGLLAMEMAIEHPEWLLINQFTDLASVHAHRETAREIIEQLDRVSVDALVAGVGSAGHLMGIAPLLAERYPSVEVVAVQPAGCDVPAGVFAPHELQGLAVGEIPPLLDGDIVSRWVSVSREEALEILRELLTLEGTAVGISSAANVAAALRVAGERPEGRVLTLTYDNLADYPELVELLIPDPPKRSVVSDDTKERA